MFFWLMRPIITQCSMSLTVMNELKKDKGDLDVSDESIEAEIARNKNCLWLVILTELIIYVSVAKTIVTLIL